MRRASSSVRTKSFDSPSACAENVADPEVAEKPRQLRVAVRVGAVEAHEDERAKLALECGQARAVGRERGPAAGREENAEEASGGEPPQRASPRARARQRAGRRRRA